uniref:THAP domain-containing protein 1 n=1 Tax=Seriola dumerili TaxID=41447 RepID=A0A3B4TS09_SERDU
APLCSKQRKDCLFLSLPLKRQVLVRRWLAALKRVNPPVSRNARVCSEHFVNEDYVEKMSFESSVLVACRTNRLKPEAVPSVFNFSSYKTGCTDIPTPCTS